MSKKLNLFFILILILVITYFLYFLSNCICMNNDKNETYIQEGIKSTCTDNYRLYGSEGEMTEPLQRHRCRSCIRSTYDPSNYEFYCPHNCRELGVSLCDQGKIM